VACDADRSVIGDRKEGISSTTEYFNQIVEQDFQQLTEQLNTVTGPDNARNRYEAFTALKRLAANMVNQKYDHGPFKLICDDLGLANLILRSEDDFTVVGVIDLEWS
jgi:hypothetical protein